MKIPETKEVMQAIEFLSSKTFISADAIRKNVQYPRYRRVSIPKDEQDLSKGFRVLHIPNKALAMTQAVLLDRVLYDFPVSKAAHCSILRRSPHTNVAPHMQGKSFFRIDFKDCFDWVTEKMLRRALTELISKAYRDVNPSVLAAVIVRLVTYKNALPQGAPASSYLLNLACNKMDKELLDLASQYDLQYTRYSDDLIFSSTEKSIPKEARKAAVAVTAKYGFMLNRDKVHYKTGTAIEPIVTGIVIKSTGSSLTGLGRKKIQAYRENIRKATFDPTISVDKVLGQVTWATSAYRGRIPKRLRKPFRDFLRTRCPEKLPKYAELFSE